MCDEHFEEDLANYLRFPPLTRRQFGAVSMGAGVAVLLPRAADALDVKESDVTVKTPDGVADCYFVHPASGASAGVLVWPDILGLRPAFRQMGKRLAESGYAVLVVNPFYRQKKPRSCPRVRVSPTQRRADRHAVGPGAERDDARDRREGVRRVPRQPGAGGQEAEDRDDRLLHGRADRDAYRGGGSRSRSARARRSMAAGW